MWCLGLDTFWFLDFSIFIMRSCNLSQKSHGIGLKKFGRIKRLGINLKQIWSQISSCLDLDSHHMLKVLMFLLNISHPNDIISNGDLLFNCNRFVWNLNLHLMLLLLGRILSQPALTSAVVYHCLYICSSQTWTETFQLSLFCNALKKFSSFFILFC